MTRIHNERGSWWLRFGPTLVAAVVLLLPGIALATGGVQIKQANNVVETYAGVVMKVTLTVRSADGDSTMVVSGFQCGQTGAVIRCVASALSEVRDGQLYDIPVKTGSFYFNLSDTAQNSPLTRVGPHSVAFEVETIKGTRIVGSGTLD